MNADGAEITSDEQTYLLDELESLLAKQLQLAHQGDLANEQFGVLAGKAGFLVGEIARTRVLDLAQFQHRRKELCRLYKILCLAVAAQKANACRELTQVHKGRKTIKTYRSNI